jgi:hypothetical protein
MVAGPNRTTRSAYRAGQILLDTTSRGTPLENAVTPKVPFHWVRVALCVKKFVIFLQGGNLRAGVTIVDGHDVGNTKYADGVCAESRYDLVTKAPEAQPKLERCEQGPGSK